METVTAIHKREREVDARPEQAILLSAETASLEALEECSNAAAAFVAYVRNLEISVTHPRVRLLLKKLPDVIGKAASLPGDLAECHLIAQKLAESRNDTTVIMSGGIPKNDNPL